MNANKFLPLPIRLSQAFEPEKFSGGASGSEITRRSFIKRTGGATVATLVAWNLASQHARAIINWENSDSNIDTSERAWRIKADAFAAAGCWEGGEQHWYHDVLDAEGNVIRTDDILVKKLLNLTMEAPATDFDSSATSRITITVQEWARMKDTTVSPNVWRVMSEVEFGEYRGGARDDHTERASITKTIIAATGEVTTVARLAFFDENWNNGRDFDAIPYDSDEVIEEILIDIKFGALSTLLNDVITVYFGGSPPCSVVRDVPFTARCSSILDP